MQPGFPHRRTFGTTGLAAEKGGAAMAATRQVLILGKGGFGTQLAELLLQSGRYDGAVFLDDNAPGCAGRLADLDRTDLLAACPDAFAAVGSNPFRLELLRRLSGAGYRLPVFVHPAAVVAPSAALGPGTVVLPFCFVGAAVRTGQGCILNAGAIIDHNAVLGDGVHAAPGAIVKAGAAVEACTKVESGQIIRSPWGQMNPVFSQHLPTGKERDMPKLQTGPDIRRPARRVYVGRHEGPGHSSGGMGPF